MNENNENGGENNGNEIKPAHKAKPIPKVKPVSSIKVIGKLRKKLGCIEDPTKISMFVEKVFEGVDDDVFIEFMRDYCDTKKDFEDFKSKIKSCNEF